MDRINRNKHFLVNLSTGVHPGHGIMVNSEYLPEAPYPFLGDLAFSDTPLEEWVGWHLRDYEARLKRLETFDDDTMPFIRTITGVEIFPAAFGCPVHVYPESSNLPMALPLVNSAEEADRLPEASLDAPVMQRIFEVTERLQERVGPEVMIGVPDMQSPFDIAAMSWQKQDVLLALYDHPDAVKRLVAKCYRLLESFLLEYKRRFPNCTLMNWPPVGIPAEFSCEFAEDECGNISAAAFEEFCLPISIEMSNTFGGLCMHCCADAEHQYENFRKIPNLRGLERHFSPYGIQVFSGHTVMIIHIYSEENANTILDSAQPNSRFLFIISERSLEEAKRLYERLRTRCPRN